jgi:hypothetical protein
MLARRRDRPEQLDYEIEALSARTATVRAVKNDAKPEKVPRKLLATVKEFGQPVFPGLKHRGSARRSSSRPSHVLIKGENFHAPQMAGASCRPLSITANAPRASSSAPLSLGCSVGRVRETVLAGLTEGQGQAR